VKTSSDRKIGPQIQKVSPMLCSSVRTRGGWFSMLPELTYRNWQGLTEKKTERRGIEIDKEISDWCIRRGA